MFSSSRLDWEPFLWEPGLSSCFPSTLANVCRALLWPQPWHIWQSAGSVCMRVCSSMCVHFPAPHRCLPIIQTAERNEPVEVTSVIFSWICLIGPLSSSARKPCQHLSLIDDKVYIVNLIGFIFLRNALPTFCQRSFPAALKPPFHHDNHKKKNHLRCR